MRGTSTSQGGEQIADLLLDVGRVAERAGDFLAENLSVATPKAQGGHLDRALTHTEDAANLGVRDGLPAPGKCWPEPLEQIRLAGHGHLVAEARKRPLQNGQGPPPLEQP